MTRIGLIGGGGIAPRHLRNLREEEHVALLEDRRRARAIEERVRRAVAACAGHPAVLAYAIGNEIPAGIVRWPGPRRVERQLEDQPQPDGGLATEPVPAGRLSGP
jgi:hypothetical protein